ncbi:xanthine dehydrogenase YagR molybdenum-binding subunit [Kibdelosporangium banguiense]|uniref:Xanthine dehydrogenase YagR molybdenum-binding subunit n=1 Tax=Kibdelosporangium banguiense TaxID=1365924 RepID=A0ABS4TPP6_9PSEU|nr:xanthine dehydrogenase family protein molybdopterin-binding subunit [Kibdelosporangium banguiense]MBP2325940.1 xanthine dehydrogenase YagR molybdenum-binding subunit [Kibdelosporangium banguiense]
MTATQENTVGKPVDRVDGVAKTTGAAQFTADFPYPDLAHAALVHATISRGRVTSIDTAAASAFPGVITVISHQNAPALKPPAKPSIMDLSTMASGTTVNYLQDDKVYWDGQPVAVVVAETSYAAREAAALVRVEYETVESSVDFSASEHDATLDKGSSIMPAGAKKGDAQAALAEAAVSVDMRLTTPPYNHNALEPHSTIAKWEGDKLTVHDASQALDWFRSHLALRFGIPTANVRVIAPYVGGGFGGKGSVWPGTILAAMAARATGRPVRLVLTREGVYRTVGGRTPSIQRVALGADREGNLTALIHTSVARTGRAGGSFEQITTSSRHLYASPNILLEQRSVVQDLIPNTAMRAPGESIGTFALEAAMDELASRLGMDPIELRMRNEPDRNPLDGKAFSHRMLREAYALGAERFGWHNRTPEPRSMRDGRWLVGMGVASAYHPSWLFTANVTVRLSADGTVLVRCGFQEMGMGGATAQSQIAADALGVPLDAVRVEYGDSALPTAPAAGGSMQTASVANSLLEACGQLKQSVAALAKRSGTTGESYQTILKKANVPHVEAVIGSETRLGKLTGQVRFMAKFLRERRWVKAATGAQFCEVRVEKDTGEVRVSRWTGVFDVGTVINPKTAASQLRGGIVMGIGMALAEETLVDPRSGRIMNPSLAEYHVPVHADIPKIDVTWLGDPDPTMPLGLLGLGEVGITGAAAAVANAVYHATGKRINDLPITLDKVFQ